MPLSSRRDMSVSISPWCLWRCAHRGGGGAGGEIEGCAISLSTIAYPRLCTLSHPSSNLWGKVWRMQSGQEGGASGPVYKETRGWLTGSASNPPPLPSVERHPPSSSSTCTCQRCSGWDLRGSPVLSAHCSHNISLSSAPVALKIEPRRRNHVCYATPTFSVFSKAQLWSSAVV